MSGNMAYCRFQNTLADLRDCLTHWDDDQISREEEDARTKLAALCEEIAENSQSARRREGFGCIS